MDVHISMCLLISYAYQLVTVLTRSLVLTISILTPTITVEVPMFIIRTSSVLHTEKQRYVKHAVMILDDMNYVEE